MPGYFLRHVRGTLVRTVIFKFSNIFFFLSIYKKLLLKLCVRNFMFAFDVLVLVGIMFFLCQCHIYSGSCTTAGMVVFGEHFQLTMKNVQQTI